MNRHGEYKMPGGKLVVADLAIAGGRLERIQISGDFFLEPDHALDAINAALAGLSVESDEAALAAAVSAGLPADVRMYGICAEAVAVAVRRALEAGETP
ncbi:MAG TPA: biotin--protein ligase [Chiayiivirga sp.]|nr:biotin--protein ligase [Chiayiivirga sp.]